MYKVTIITNCKAFILSFVGKHEDVGIQFGCLLFILSSKSKVRFESSWTYHELSKLLSFLWLLNVSFHRKISYFCCKHRLKMLWVHLNETALTSTNYLETEHQSVWDLKASHNPKSILNRLKSDRVHGFQVLGT